VIARLRRGTEVEVLDSDGGPWTHGRAGQNEGYIFSRSLRLAPRFTRVAERAAGLPAALVGVAGLRTRGAGAPPVVCGCVAGEERRRTGGGGGGGRGGQHADGYEACSDAVGNKPLLKIALGRAS